MTKNIEKKIEVYCKDCKNFLPDYVGSNGVCRESLRSKKSVITGKMQHFYTTKCCKEKNKDFHCKDYNAIEKKQTFFANIFKKYK